MLENLDEEPMNEEIDDAVVANDSSDDEDETPTNEEIDNVELANTITKQITSKIGELKSIYTQHESTLNHKHSDLTKINVRDSLKLITKDYEMKLKTLNPDKYNHKQIVVHELKQLECKLDYEITKILANVEHSKASQISYTMTHTPEPDWLHTIEEDGLAYYTECSGEQNLYRLSMSGSLMQVGSYKRERDEDGYKVRVLSFLSEPVFATEPAPDVVEEPPAKAPTPTPTPSPSPPPSTSPTPMEPSSPMPSHYTDKCPFDEKQIMASYTYKNAFAKAMKKNEVIDPDRDWKHFVHAVDPLDENPTVGRFVFAKYNKDIVSPTLDQMSYEIHYYPMWKHEKNGQTRKKLRLIEKDGNPRVRFWEPSKVMWSWMLDSHGLDSPSDITIHGCRV
jgi:hypothetical protein